MTPFNLIAIGGETAGVVTAAGAASLGLRAALVEGEALGGDCLWTGCVPSKEGFIKIVTRKNGRIVGATVLGSGAGDLILPVVMAMNARMKISRLSNIVYPYPTMVEGVKRAADSYYREQFAGRTGEWLKKVVRWLK